MLKMHTIEKRDWDIIEMQLRPPPIRPGPKRSPFPTPDHFNAQAGLASTTSDRRGLFGKAQSRVCSSSAENQSPSFGTLKDCRRSVCAESVEVRFPMLAIPRGD